MLALAFLVKVLAVIGDLANRWIGCGRYLHQVQPALARELHRFERLQNAQLGAFLINDANLARPDSFVYPDAIIRPETPLGDKPTSENPNPCFRRQAGHMQTSYTRGPVSIAWRRSVNSNPKAPQECQVPERAFAGSLDYVNQPTGGRFCLVAQR
jgi:hypothetical protein